LHRILERVDSGRLVSPEQLFIDKFSGTPKPSIGAPWRLLFPQCYFWLDYAGVPQPNLDLHDMGTTQSGSDHRSFGGEDMILAIRSIPAYIDASSLMLILAPTSDHHDVAGRLCNYASWTRRGWCRLERFCAVFARVRVPMAICLGPEAPVHYESMVAALTVQIGYGDFSCCQLGHSMQGKPIPCDKLALRPVLTSLMVAVADKCRMTQDPAWARYVTASCARHLHGLPTAPGDPPALPWEKDPESFLAALRWDDAALPKSCSGWPASHRWTLLHYAAITGSATLVREILLRDGVSSVDVMSPGLPNVIAGQYTALAHAVASGHGNADAAEMLTNARANPMASVRGIAGYNLLMHAVLAGSAEQLRWTVAHYQGDMNARGAIFGQTPLCTVLSQREDKDLVWPAMVSLRADVRCADFFHGPDAVLYYACFSRTPSLAAVRMLIEARCALNRPATPTTRLMKALASCSLAAERFARVRGRAPGVFASTWARMVGSTPLHYAAWRGSCDVVRLLVEARARCLRNELGYTPLQLAAEAFGGQPPDALVQLLA